MKINRLTMILAGALCFMVVGISQVRAQIATNVAWYVLPTTLPDTIHLEFGTARDNWLTPLMMGISPTTGSRVGQVTAIEVRDVFEVPDMCISTNSGLKLWRGVFNPPAPYTNMTGLRIYGTVVGVPQNGQIRLSGISQRTICERIPLLNNQSSFASLTYSVSRRGILKGTDGKLWTADDLYLMNGETGTTLVDAVVLIGSRIGAIANSQADIDTINSLVTVQGTKVTFEYYFNSVTRGAETIMLYPSGGIPNNTNRIAFFGTPHGMLFSVVGPPGSGPFTLESSRRIDATWNLETTTGTEGSSVFLKYTRNPTNDVGFVRGK